MKKKLSLKNLEVKSFVTTLNEAQSNDLRGMGTDLIQCGSQVDACLTAQICANSRINCLTDAVAVTGHKAC